MTLHVKTLYEDHQFSTLCAICGRTTGGRFNPPVRHVLMDDENKIGEVCERCAYGSIDLWRVALSEYAIRLEMKAAVLRSLASRVDDAVPAQEGIVEELVRKNVRRRPGGPQRRPPFPPFRNGD